MKKTGWCRAVLLLCALYQFIVYYLFIVLPWPTNPTTHVAAAATTTATTTTAIPSPTSSLFPRTPTPNNTNPRISTLLSSTKPSFHCRFATYTSLSLLTYFMPSAAPITTISDILAPKVSHIPIIYCGFLFPLSHSFLICVWKILFSSFVAAFLSLIFLFFSPYSIAPSPFSPPHCSLLITLPISSQFPDSRVPSDFCCSMFRFPVFGWFCVLSFAYRLHKLFLMARALISFSCLLSIHVHTQPQFQLPTPLPLI
ncbi:hypothetical protein BDN70DRAFT_146666 [Pholiota conissans]|uniref:Uncharacterized protein n=1 Tax=Pholiota conissans TaxID=109636 RepID=A0A9P5ZA42_9AGAR|nr:hypothetical protein BDN70DRAFT_146666 [Pholiota conissans]